MNQINTERLHLFAPNVYVGIQAEIEGKYDQNKIEDAISTVIDHVEVLHTKIVIAKDGTAYYEKAAPQKHIYNTKESVETILNQVIHRGMDIANGELIHFYLMEHSHSGFCLMILAHHLVGDGMSIAYLMDLLLKSMSGQSIPYQPVTILDPAEFPPKSRSSFLFKMLLNHFNRSWLKDKKIYTMADRERIIRTYAQCNHSTLFETTLSGNDFLTVKAKASQMGITINTLISTAILKAYGKKQNLGIAVSVRADGDTSISNIASGTKLIYKYKNHKTFQSNARTIQEKIKKKTSNPRRLYVALRFQELSDPSLLDGIAIHKYLGETCRVQKTMARLSYCDGNEREFGITNLGVSKLKSQYGEYTLAGLSFVAPAVPYSKRTIAIITHGNRMNLVYHTIVKDTRQEKRLFDAILKGIKECK